MAKVLVVEDNHYFAEALVACLESEGHEVVWTASGLEGVLLAAQQPFDVALLDVQVEDLSGLGVARAVHDLWANVAVIVMSSLGGSSWKRDAFRAGATACLSKPFSGDKLIQLIDTILSGERRGPDSNGDVRQLTREDIERVRALSPEEMDALPFGVVRVDADGRITEYNAYESRAAGLPQRTVVGRRVCDIAPCVLVKEFVAQLKEGFERRELDAMFRFVFPHHEAACVVAVRLYYDRNTSQMLIFVSKQRGRPASGDGGDG